MFLFCSIQPSLQEQREKIRSRRYRRTLGVKTAQDPFGAPFPRAAGGRFCPFAAVAAETVQLAARKRGTPMIAKFGRRPG